MNVFAGLIGGRPIFHLAAPTSLVAAPLSLLLLVVAVAAHGATQQPNGRFEDGWEALIRSHLVRYPRMEPADLYKLLHQAVLGSEHAISDTASVREWLMSELATMGSGPAEPLVDSLRADGRIVRIHLRPFAAAGGDPEALLQAFIATGAVSGDRGELGRALGVAIDLARAKALPWAPSTVTELFARLAGQGYPAVHHSATFTEQYRPAYRVVASELLGGVLPAVDQKTPEVRP